MRLTFIGSRVQTSHAHLGGIEISAIASVSSRWFKDLVFGGSSEGLMGSFATAFQSRGGQVNSVAPYWLNECGLAYQDGSFVQCESLAQRKDCLYDSSNAVICYPGGLGTLDKFFDLLAYHSVGREYCCPPVFLYNWENFYAPLLLQIETASLANLIHPSAVASLHEFSTVEGYEKLLTDIFGKY